MRLVTSSSSSSSSSRNGSSGASSRLLDVDVVDHRLGGLLLAGLDLVERHDVDAGRRRKLGILFLGLGCRPRARRRGALKDRAAFRADDRVFVEVEEFCAAVLALALGSEFGFGHCDQFPGLEGGLQDRPVSRPLPVVSMRFWLAGRQAPNGR